MSLSRNLLVVSLLGLVFITSFATNSKACTTILVGSEQTVDGSMLIARNVDELDAFTIHNVQLHPRLAGQKGAIFHAIFNNFTYPLPSNSFGYLGLPYANYKQTAMEEAAINEFGVTISATETILNSSQVLKMDPYVENEGIDEDSIPSIIMPSVSTAQEGVLLLGKIIETKGAADGFGVALADKEGIWYLETASGHHWVAFKLDSGKMFFSANQGRIQFVDLTKPEKYLGSKDLIDFAIINGWHKPGDEFNFFKIYVDNSTPVNERYNYPRIEQLHWLYTGTRIAIKDGLFPVETLPIRKLDVADVEMGLKDHYSGSLSDPYESQNPLATYRPVSVFRTSFSHITKLRPWLPIDIGAIVFVAMGFTDLSIYIPFYFGVTEIPTNYSVSSVNPLDETSIFWKYRKLQALVMQNYPKYAPPLKKEIALFEAQIKSRQEDMEKKYLLYHSSSRTEAKQIIQDFTERVVSDSERFLESWIIRLAKELGMTGYNSKEFSKLIEQVEKKYHFAGK